MRNVALKQLAEDLRDVTPARLRFLREVQVTAQLDHPYIVPVYGLEVRPDRSPVYAMKLVTGNTLEEYLQTAIDAYVAGRVPAQTHSLPARIEHLLKVGQAVDYAHGKGVVHRDPKPANIMLSAHRGTFVMDCAICHVLGTDDPDPPLAPMLSEATGGLQPEYGSVVGTLRYMAPEQAQGRRQGLGPRSDQCARGHCVQHLSSIRDGGRRRVTGLLRALHRDNSCPQRSLRGRLGADSMQRSGCSNV